MVDTGAPPNINKSPISQIITDLYALNLSEISKDRREKIENFIKGTINGDTSETHAVTGAILGEDRRGVLLYILTNKRAIKIEIDATKERSQTFPLSKIISISRESTGEKEKIQVYFESDSFGLVYNPQDEHITNFFQALDKARLGEDS